MVNIFDNLKSAMSSAKEAWRQKRLGDMFQEGTPLDQVVAQVPDIRLRELRQKATHYLNPLGKPPDLDEGGAYDPRAVDAVVNGYIREIGESRPNIAARLIAEFKAGLPV